MFSGIINSNLTKSAALFLLLTGIAMAQVDSPAVQPTQATSPTPPKSICETTSGFNDFDFWVGTWKVYSNDDARTFQGDNIISKQHRNCLIMENWTNAQGGDGSSMNYFDPVENQWRQLWVAGGYSIDYTGGLDKDGAMLLKGKINYYQPKTSHAFRGKWTANDDGSVRQFFEQYDEEKQEWTVWFDGLYIRQ